MRTPGSISSRERRLPAIDQPPARAPGVLPRVEQRRQARSAARARSVRLAQVPIAADLPAPRRLRVRGCRRRRRGSARLAAFQPTSCRTDSVADRDVSREAERGPGERLVARRVRPSRVVLHVARRVQRIGVAVPGRDGARRHPRADRRKERGRHQVVAPGVGEAEIVAVGAVAERRVGRLAAAEREQRDALSGPHAPTRLSPAGRRTPAAASR